LILASTQFFKTPESEATLFAITVDPRQCRCRFCLSLGDFSKKIFLLSLEALYFNIKKDQFTTAIRANVLFAVFRIIRYNIKGPTRSAGGVGTHNDSTKKKDMVDTTKTTKSTIIFMFRRYLEN
jgi:hypothetical protein